MVWGAGRKAHVHVSIKRIQRGRNHTYTINGHKAVGVTTAIGNGLPKPALLAWGPRLVAQEAAPILLGGPAAVAEWMEEHNIRTELDAINQLKGAPTRAKDGAAVRGTKVHAIAEQLTRREEDIAVPEELRGHVESVIKFLREWKVRPLLVEHVIGSYQWGYAGTFDLVAEVADGRRILFDYKTGASGVWPETALQLAAYRYADAYVAPDGTEIPMREVGITEAKAVWVRADGYDVIPLNTDGSVFKTFLHVLQVAKAVPTMAAWRGEMERPSWLKTF